MTYLSLCICNLYMKRVDSNMGEDCLSQPLLSPNDRKEIHDDSFINRDFNR